MNIFTSICDRVEAALGTTVIRVQGNPGERDAVIRMSNQQYEEFEEALDNLIDELTSDPLTDAINSYGHDED